MFGVSSKLLGECSFFTLFGEEGELMTASAASAPSYRPKVRIPQRGSKRQWTNE